MATTRPKNSKPKAATAPARAPRAAAASPAPTLGVKTLVAVGAASSAVSMTVAALLLAAAFHVGLLGPLRPGPNPGPIAVDPAFVSLGETYGPELIRAYAANWRTLADRIDSGKPIGAATTAFGTDWTASRNALFDAQLAGPFKELLPEGAPEDQITAAQRAAYAAACRGVAEGLTP